MQHQDIIPGLQKMPGSQHVQVGIFVQRGEKSDLLAFSLNAQHIYHIHPFQGFIQAVIAFYAQFLYLGRYQSRRSHYPYLAAKFAEAIYVGTSHPAMQYISHYGNLQVIQGALFLLDTEHVQQRLGRMLISPIAGIYHFHTGIAGCIMRSAAHSVAYHHQVKAHDLNGLDGVPQAFTFLYTAGSYRQINRIRAEVFPGYLKRGAGSSTGLIENSNHGLSTQSGNLLDITPDNVLHRHCRSQDEFNIFPAQFPQPQQILILFKSHYKASS